MDSVVPVAIASNFIGDDRSVSPFESIEYGLTGLGVHFAPGLIFLLKFVGAIVASVRPSIRRFLRLVAWPRLNDNEVLFGVGDSICTRAELDHRARPASLDLEFGVLFPKVVCDRIEFRKTALTFS